jgi:hypothetical protein
MSREERDGIFRGRHSRGWLDNPRRSARGDVLALTELLASLAMSFDRPEPAAVLSAASANYATIHTAVDLPGTVAHLRAILGEVVFEKYAARGAAMDFGYARQQIQRARTEDTTPHVHSS